MVISTRRSPYIWVTWLTKLMAGESSCWWSAWFKAHHQYSKLPGNFGLAAWQTEHASLLRDCAVVLQAEGYLVSLEDQNAFHLTAPSGITLAGKPDLLAVYGDRALVVDMKTGSPCASHVLQVQIYLAVLPFVFPQYRGLGIEGRVQYHNQMVTVPASSIDAGFRARLREAVAMVSSPKPPNRVASFRECHWCDIGPDDCAERIDGTVAEIVTNHDLF